MMPLCGFYSERDYLVRERMAIEKSEFVNGKIYPMPSFGRAHNRLSVNLLGLLGKAFDDRPGLVCSSLMKVWSAAAHTYYYPAASALCGDPAFLDEIEDVLINPSVVFEIYSDSTKRICLHEKFAVYQLIPSVSEYVLISENDYHAYFFTKSADDDWSLEDRLSLEQSIPIRSLEVEVPMAELYRRVTLTKREA